MNVLFLVRYASYLKSKKTYNLTKGVIEENGHEFHSNIEYSPTAAENPEDYVVHINTLRKKADIVIADINEESTGVGHDIEWSLINRKPVLVFFDKKNRDSVSIIISKKEDKLLSKVSYEKENKLRESLKNFLNTAKQKLDTKFILIISPEIDQYLKWAADFKRMHKAQIVRNAVEKEMENDKDYQKYLEEQNK
jgi:hypothetical protein